MPRLRGVGVFSIVGIATPRARFLEVALSCCSPIGIAGGGRFGSILLVSSNVLAGDGVAGDGVAGDGVAGDGVANIDIDLRAPATFLAGLGPTVFDLGVVALVRGCPGVFALPIGS